MCQFKPSSRLIIETESHLLNHTAAQPVVRQHGIEQLAAQRARVHVLKGNIDTFHHTSNQRSTTMTTTKRKAQRTWHQQARQAWQK